MRLSMLVRCACAAVIAALSEAGGAAELVIGQVAPFSGSLAPTGTHMRAGAQVYIDSINASGGVHGTKLKLVSKDDGYKAEDTVRLVRELVKEADPVALLGLVGTGNVEALVKNNVLAEAGIPVVGVRTGANSLRRPVNPYLFHTRASYAEEIDAIVQQLAAMGSSRLAIFYQDDPFGLDGLASAETSVKDAKSQILAKGAYEKNTTKVEAAVKTIVAVQPQAVIMVANTAASAEFVKQMRAAGSNAQLIAVSVTDGPQVARTIGKETAHGLGIVQIVPDPMSRAIPVARELQDNFKKFPVAGVELGHTMLEGYLAAKVLVEGLRRAGPSPTRKTLREALEATRNFDAGGIFLSYSGSSHSGSPYVDITVLSRDGKVLR